MSKPNVVFLLTDQWRLQALGYAGNSQVRTPNIDRLAGESVNFRNAISGYSVCCPWRASFLTGQYPLTHGVIVNDVPISGEPVGLGDSLPGGRLRYRVSSASGMSMGSGRSNYIPPERRLGFDTFQALECTHDYHQSAYFDGDDPTKRIWDGYDVFAQKAAAQRYMASRARTTSPFCWCCPGGRRTILTKPRRIEYRDMYDRDARLSCGPMCRRTWPTRRANGWPAIMRTAAPSTGASAISWRRWTNSASPTTRCWSSPPTMATCWARKA